ncbi:thioredoxin-disulfide reductase [Holospora curviuscula]|uniref:Thioredoxin reductase n=1 Tax=Holospora curviuscula TaxID=1082868 RepID=A0A2S5RA63_9PROT|nr:thioredoxin-disulfide reductase [Holospora curviuscula]PPE04221.1 Thioredoxin reductase [Holospora curviuscula]
MRHIGIIGSGPAGLTAAIYAARGGVKATVWAGPEPGGQLMLTTEVENYPGFKKAVLGPALMEEMTEQAKACGAEIITEEIMNFEKKEKKIILQGTHQYYECDALIISTGAKTQWLGLESEAYFRGYGVSSCAVCDGRFFKDRSVAVVGGGNTAVEEALYLSNQCSQVILVHRRHQLRAEKVLQKRLFTTPNVRIMWNHVLEEVLGVRSSHKYVTGIKLRDLESNVLQQVDVDGVFIAIGHKPETHWMHGKLKLDPQGYILCSKGSTHTSCLGVFAAGDVMDAVYRQAVTAAGFGCMAALDAMNFLENLP